MNDVTNQALEFVRWAFEQATLEGSDLDGASVQDKLEELGIIELREVDSRDNDYDAEELYFLKEPYEKAKEMEE